MNCQEQSLVFQDLPSKRSLPLVVMFQCGMYFLCLQFHLVTGLVHNTMYLLVTNATLCLIRSSHGTKHAKFASVRVVEIWRVFITPLNKVKPKQRIEAKDNQIFQHFVSVHVIFTDMGISSENFRRFRILLRHFQRFQIQKICDYLYFGSCFQNKFSNTTICIHATGYCNFETFTRAYLFQIILEIF